MNAIEERMCLHSRSPDYTKGIFQSIGFKEFHAYLILPEEERASEKVSGDGSSIRAYFAIAEARQRVSVGRSSAFSTIKMHRAITANSLPPPVVPASRGPPVFIPAIAQVLSRAFVCGFLYASMCLRDVGDDEDHSDARNAET